MAHVADHLSFATLADLECAVVERCRVLKDDPLRLGTNFHWWPKPVRPTSSPGNRSAPGDRQGARGASPLQ